MLLKVFRPNFIDNINLSNVWIIIEEGAFALVGNQWWDWFVGGHQFFSEKHF